MKVGSITLWGLAWRNLWRNRRRTWLTAGGIGFAVWLLVFVALAGIGGTFELPSVQGLISDVMPPAARMSAVAVYSLGIRAVGALGALVGGGSPSGMGNSNGWGDV